MKTTLVLLGALVTAAIASPTDAAAARSPLDFNATLLAKPAALVPKGLKLGEGCLPPVDGSCAHVGRGISYVVEDDMISVVELSRVRGRFAQPLPFGLTETSGREDVRKALAKNGVPLATNLKPRGDISSQLISINKDPDCWIQFDFDRRDRLDKASLRCITSSF